MLSSCRRARIITSTICALGIGLAATTGCVSRTPTISSTATPGVFAIANPATPLPDPAQDSPTEIDVATKDGITVVTTPYYAVALAGEGWSWDYFNEVHSWANDGSTLLRGHQLTLHRNGSAVSWADIYVTTTDWTGIQGTFVDKIAGPLAGWDGYQVVVATAADPGYPDTPQYQAGLNRVDAVIAALALASS